MKNSIVRKIFQEIFDAAVVKVDKNYFKILTKKLI